MFARTYEQVYFLEYSLLPNLPGETVERLPYAYRAFPWRGGFSALDFYQQLKYSAPPQERLEVVAIQYGSPGFIELGLVLGAALTVRKIVKVVAESLTEMNTVYNSFYSDVQKRKLLRLDVKKKKIEVSEAELHLLEEYADTMAKLLGFDGHEELTRRTGDPFITLKILFSFYRRLRILAGFSKDGKADL
ncbi:MAG: hypothetical protein WAO35_09400 [Terriglobia bacterium]